MFNQSPKPVIQANRLPVLIALLIIMAVFLIFMIKVQMNQNIVLTAGKPPQSLDVTPKAMAANWFNQDKFKDMKLNLHPQVMRPLSIKEKELNIITSQKLDLRKDEIADEYVTDLEIKKIEDKDKIDAKKMEEQALRSPLSIDVPPWPGSTPRKTSSLVQKNELSSGLDQITAMINSIGGAKEASLKSLVGQIGLGRNDQQGKVSFLKDSAVDDDYLNHVKEKPRSPYELKAGGYIPAALITGINSDLPGAVSAQVTDDVYDSVTGNYVLIPQGAKLIGQYNSSLSFGQKRVQVVWDRMIFPDGASLDLERMQGVDISGNSGFHDRVDNHYVRIYGNAILLSLMGAGYDALNKNAQQTNDLKATVAASVGQRLADVSQQALERNMDIQPTLIINPGYKFKVLVMKDIVIEAIRDAKGTSAYTE